MKTLLFIFLFPFIASAQIPFVIGTTNRTNYSEDFVIVNNSVKGTDGYEHSYVGTWNDFTAAGHYDGDGTYSAIAGDSIIFRFNGTKAELYFEEKSTLGKANISLDGGAYTEIDLYDAVNTQQVLKYTTGTISQAVHTLVIKVLHTKHASSTNYYVVYDYVKVFSPLPVPIPPEPESIAWHVETTGSDSDPCTLAEPCLTLDYVVDNIAQDGDTILVGTGTFVEIDNITPGHGVSIIGSGVNQTTIKLDASLNHTFVPFDYAQEEYAFQYISGAGNSVLSDLTIEGNARAAHGGIYVENSDTLTILRVSIENFGFTGIYFRNIEDCTLKDSQISNSSLSLSSFSSAGLMSGTSEGLTIDNVVLDEKTVGSVRGYNVKAFGPSPTQPVIEDLILRDVVTSTSTTSNFGGGGTANIGIELHNVLLTNALIEGGSSTETMSIVRPDGQTDPATHALTIDGHRFNPVGGYCLELTMHNVEIKNSYFNGGKFGGVVSFDTFGPAATNWYFHNNTFYDIDTPSGVAGMIRSDNFGFDSLRFDNNTVHFTSGATNVSVLLTRNGVSSDKVYMRNNAVWDEGSAAVFTLQSGGSVTNSTISYNQFYGLPTGAISGVTYSNNLNTDPVFVGAGAKPDPFYRPDTGSPMIESGTDVGLPYNGDNPTRGVFEIQE